MIYTMGYLSYPKGRGKGLILMNFSALPLMIISFMSAWKLLSSPAAGAAAAAAAEATGGETP